MLAVYLYILLFIFFHSLSFLGVITHDSQLITLEIDPSN